MKTQKHISGLVILIAICCSANAQDLDFSGFIDSYHAVRLEKPNDFMSSRSRFREELRIISGSSSLYVSINANHNYLLPDRTFIELREAYFNYAGQNWDLRAGRQIIIWGVADGFRITDIISPMDFTEFLARDYDDIRMPVDALKFRAFKENIKLELVFIPVLQTYIYPADPKNPWSIIPPSNEGPEMIIAPANKPEATMKNSEVGGKLSFYLSGFDVSVSSLYTWNKMPVFETAFTESYDTTILTPVHQRLGMTGIDLSKPIGSFVLRAEGAYFAGENHTSRMNGNTSHLIEKDVARYMIGLDYYPGSDWTVTGQFAQTSIIGFNDDLEGDQHTFLATLGISKKVLRSTLALSSFGYVDITNGGYFNRTSIDYSLSDHIHLLTGVDLFGGDGGMFGIYKDNSEIWMKVKYSF